MQQSDYGQHLFGYMITGLMSEEWYHWSIHSNELSDYSSHAVRAFRGWLRELGAFHTLRHSRGGDVLAACGQLAAGYLNG